MKNLRKHCAFIVIATLLPVTCATASDAYTVTLASVWTNNTASGESSENIQFAVNDVLQTNNDRNEKEGATFWHVDRYQSRSIQLTCVESKPFGTSFSVKLNVVQDETKNEIGTVDVTLKEEKGEPSLAFEMQVGDRTTKLRKKLLSGEKTLWMTRVFPKDESANYVLRFRIKKISAHE